ncbi:2-amino-4-hydroxy-6-hydroxymethyldihydropteridine diphosphokinase [uncultured Duncaniella sp.]|uniref:2-amino-4-hydroxy-6- hydroxymethyldihydropteridine diphosphokinase n=1 Tax=uncultured Duncaniella sp. TaxID=2768039 RepID=UPI002613D56F|nr:2-amino-4-hydroxy-6-hydroxymethyldihydropteridine diphosphokinase [uncultured Duncaniella sp.]
MIDIHINIGSNSGDREALIERAVTAVSSIFPDAVEIRRSDIIETPPWGFDSPNPFLNIGMLVRLDSNPGTVVGTRCSAYARRNSDENGIKPDSDTVSVNISDADCISSGIRATARPYNASRIESELMDISQKLKEEFAVDVLHSLQRVQASIDSSPHRDATGAYIDRAIDIDLIAINDWIVETPELSLPHPRMLLRDFVMIPLKQLDPQWKHPSA